MAARKPSHDNHRDDLTTRGGGARGDAVLDRRVERADEIIQVMDRRAFIGGLALATLAAPRVTPGQPARKVHRIGILGLGLTSELVGPQPRSPSVKALLGGLRELGYVYGEHFVTEPRGADSRPDRYPSLAAELVRLQVDVILAPGPMLPALKQATSTIPVIMTATLDPVAQGYVQSLGHPGGNFTGFSLQSVEATGKRLELLTGHSVVDRRAFVSGRSPSTADAQRNERKEHMVDTGNPN